MVVLVELQNALYHRNQNPQASGGRCRNVETCCQGHECSRYNLDDLEPLISLLAMVTLRSYQLIWSSSRSRVGSASVIVAPLVPLADDSNLSRGIIHLT